MTTYAWPGWSASGFEMRVMPNAFTFTSTYTKTTQSIDFLGERWIAKVDLAADRDPIVGAAREAFFDRLRGPVNLISMWNLRRPVPQGTLRDGLPGNVKNASLATVSVVNGSAAAVTVIYGTASLPNAVAQLANTATIGTVPGATLRAGDHLGIAGQMVRVMADALADGAGQMAIEFLPRVRTAWPAATPIVWYRPTANFMLKADGVPVAWHPGMFDGSSFELIEAY